MGTADVGIPGDPGHGARHVELERGEVFAEQGERAAEIYFIRSGRVASLRTAEGGAPVVVREMGPGEIAGKVPVVSEPRHGTTLRAEEPTTIAAVALDDLDRMLDVDADLAERIAAEARRRLEWRAVEKLVQAMLGKADPAVVQDLHDRVEWLRLDAGEQLFAIGDSPDAAYFVATGRLLVSVPADGDERAIAELGPGELVGELGLIDDAPRNANVTAIREATLGRLSRRTVTWLMRRHPEIMLRLTQIIVDRLARPGTPIDRAKTVAVAVTADLDPASVTSALMSEILRHGSALHLSSERVNGALNRPDIADCAPGEPTEMRLSEFLDEAEIEHRHVVYETDSESSAWSRRVLRRADRVLIAASADPGPEEQRRIGEALKPLDGVRHSSRWIVAVHPSVTVRPVGTSGVIDRFGVDRVVHLRRGSNTDIARIARLATGDATGLVLGGGGARGFAHVGVSRALAELGVPVDITGGSSIGAVMAAVVANGRSPGEQAELVVRGMTGLLDYTVPVVSLMKGERITSAIEGEFGDRHIEDLLIPFFCVSTNLTRSTRHVHRRGEIVRALRASIAIPGVLPPVPYGDDLLVDGGVLDNLPARLLRDSGMARRTIAVEVAPPRGLRAESDYGHSVSGWRALRARIGRGASPYPGLGPVLVRSMLVGSMQERHRVVDDEIADLFVSLELPDIGLLDFSDPEPVIEMGYEAALPQIAAWLESGALEPGD